MEQRWTSDMRSKLNHELTDPQFIGFLKFLMSTQDETYVYQGLREVEVTLCNGRQVKVSSSVFVRKVCKRGRPPKGGHKGVTRHPGLELAGFIDKKSPVFISKVVRCAVSCSSFEAAAKELKYQGVKTSADHIRTLSYQFADFFMAERVKNSLDGSEKQEGLIIEITADGGRIRLKENIKRKNGKRKNTTFEGNWREPKLFSIRVLNKKGELLKEVPQLMDATMENWQAAFELLKEYLKNYNLSKAAQITFIADGSSSIWTHVDVMFEQLNVTEYEAVIDHMHAKQIVDLLNKNTVSKRKKKKNEQIIHELLWEGDIDGISAFLIAEFGKLRRDKKAALKKLANYFGRSPERFQYARFKKEKRPVGSGSVESAIRRVINLKLKSNGIFWLQENCERMLYLRCQFLTTRWGIFEEKLDLMRLNFYGVNELEEYSDAA